MKVSVVIPVYNKEKYINDIICDLKRQKFTEYECILIDDGSTDKSGQICDAICREDERFRVFHLKNGGVSSARNYGLRCANGKYITFIDSDDRVHPKYLQNLYECIERNNVDFVISGLEKYWINSEERVCVQAPYEGIKKKEDVLLDFAHIQKETGIFGFCVAKIFKRHLIQNIEFDKQLSLAEDFEFYLQVYRKAKTFYFDNKHYYYYLQDAENSSVSVEDEKVDYFSQLKVFLRYKKFLDDEGAYYGENKDIVDAKINDYIYFTLFYCSKDNVESRFREMKKLVESNTISYGGRTAKEKYVLHCFQENQLGLIKVYLVLYKNVREIYRKLRNRLK